jgi:hypothetical protein
MTSRHLACLATLWFVSSAVLKTPAQAAPAEQAPARPTDSIHWYDARNLTLEGQAWTNTSGPYDRLPARAEGKVRDVVWRLSRQSASLLVRFLTDSDTIHVRWTLTSGNLAKPHMAATGVSGLDLYVRQQGRQWRWLACAKPTQKTNTVKLVSGIPATTRMYMLYLPLYNGVSSLKIGVPKGHNVTPAPARPADRQKPIVFYGTSITQGGCASRPGMVHTAILGRRFDRPVINLGFSGNGRMETEVAEFIAEIDAAVYVLDCLPNMSAQEVARRTAPCVAVLRRAHPTTPILLVEDRTYADAFLVTPRRQRNQTDREALRKVYEKLKAAGDNNLYYLEGDRLLGDDGEATVDGSHPTDLGFVRQAAAFADALAPILKSPTQ